MNRSRFVNRGRHHVLYNYGPEKVFFHEGSGQIEEVLGLKQDSRTPNLRVNLDQLRARIRDEINTFRHADLDASMIASTAINVVKPDWVVARLSPPAYYCQRCGHLYIADPEATRGRTEDLFKEIERVLPVGRRCLCTTRGQPCGGTLRQYDVLTTHVCGEQVFVPAQRSLGRCPTHGVEHLHWQRQGSERAARWRITCMAPGCTHTRSAQESFFRRHFGCSLDNMVQWNADVTASWSTAPFMKASHYMSRVVNLLNSDNTLQEITAGTRFAAIATAGCLRDEPSFRRYDPNAGFDVWSELYTGDSRATGPSAGLQELLEMRDAFRQDLREGPAKELALRNIEEQIRAASPLGGSATSYTALFDLTNKTDFARQIRDTTLYMDKTRGFALPDLVGQTSIDPEYSATLENASRALPGLGLRDMRYQEKIPLTAALVGFVRGSYDPRMAKLNLFRSGGRDGGIDVYGNQTATEGIWVQVDPTATLRWLNTQGPTPLAGPGTFSGDLLALQGRFQRNPNDLFGAFSDPWTEKHYGLLHTMSHLFIKAAGRLTGLEQEGVSEEILPFTNSFLVYANHSSDFVLGGLQLMMEHHMATVLGGLREDALRCVYNPVCQTQKSACHGCIHLGEVSCANFNRTLRRDLLVGPRGFWA